MYLQVLSVRVFQCCSYFGATDVSSNEVVDDDYDDVAEEELERIESTVTDPSRIDRANAVDSEMQQLSYRLAAAYYMSTYSPLLHQKNSAYVFYSFPWVVASDVIYCGLRELNGK